MCLMRNERPFELDAVVLGIDRNFVDTLPTKQTILSNPLPCQLTEIKIDTSPGLFCRWTAPKATPISLDARWYRAGSPRRSEWALDNRISICIRRE
jgi:hypothetical protein